MHWLRALAHLVLALAFLTAAVAQMAAVDVGPVAAPRHHDHHAAAGVEHAVGEHAVPATTHPVHGRDGCQTACCFSPGQVPGRSPEASPIGSFCAVSYFDVVRSVSDRVDAPDPGIPKHAS